MISAKKDSEKLKNYFLIDADLQQIIRIIKTRYSYDNYFFLKNFYAFLQNSYSDLFLSTEEFDSFLDGLWGRNFFEFKTSCACSECKNNAIPFFLLGQEISLCLTKQEQKQESKMNVTFL